MGSPPTLNEALAILRDLARITAVELQVVGQGGREPQCKFCGYGDGARNYGRGIDQHFIHGATCVWARARRLLGEDVHVEEVP